MFEELRVAISKFLQIKIIETPFLLVNFWHIVHFIDTFIVMFIVSKIFKDSRRKWTLMIILILGYEILEAIWIKKYPNLFDVETRLDIIYDLVFGVLGAYFYTWIEGKLKK
jgi:hypothetical protein